MRGTSMRRRTTASACRLRLECYPNQKTAWFWTYLVLPTLTGPVVVRDHEVPLPRQGLEVRAEGLWCELWCETPLEHWTYGLEAFAVNLEAPEDALTGEIGERIPIGLDLEWEIDGPIHAHRARGPSPATSRPASSTAKCCWVVNGSSSMRVVRTTEPGATATGSTRGVVARVPRARPRTASRGAGGRHRRRVRTRRGDEPARETTRARARRAPARRVSWSTMNSRSRSTC